MAYHECEKCCFDFENLTGHSDFPHIHNVKDLNEWEQGTEYGVSYEFSCTIICPICGTEEEFTDGSA